MFSRIESKLNIIGTLDLFFSILAPKLLPIGTNGQSGSNLSPKDIRIEMSPMEMYRHGSWTSWTVMTHRRKGAQETVNSQSLLILWFQNWLKTAEQDLMFHFYYPLQQIDLPRFTNHLIITSLLWIFMSYFGLGLAWWVGLWVFYSRAVLAWKAKVWKVPPAVSWTCPKRIRESQLTQTYIIYKAPGYFIVNFQLQPWPMKGRGWVTWYHPKFDPREKSVRKN